ncbi:acyl-CoA dehydrogenase family protein [Bacillus cytotoxicus]|uniref:Acyl-CoA dehydrogenase type 2 domain n=2 Tax=Bacillus cytotoxicus TaxID=580165 RepID=A0AAX2CHS3_9BACI|nr:MULTISPECIES: acyl-CoA dehydrogenase family protein [Bacillus cereus group]ABS22332.1 Acyl-CoA dehydrogenase type 2 domain [Bacillus cytotoxicus NVH 391-98]AWC28943.1 acyl-CoA dehydrogenase [Bacillus cytotoxicus]AWC32937.1 acyl-CoA dehydrogenase [Bacillus cytotoxicus]AWC36962.1 acyl-CoA dehydrogenase [Bacillus cytotoxicus]AWC39670.1 acyl-CoA dehydrogenase [Bacillus cytotoxicus]
MTISFVETEEQSLWIEKIQKFLPKFQERECELRELGSFPFENINELKDIGYTTLTLPKDCGGQEISLYDFVLYQEKIAEGDGATALSIGWHLGIVKELTENQSWKPDMFAWFCEEVKKGALFNRAATERKTGSPTRGGRPETLAVKKGEKWIINGRKTFTTMAPMLDYFIISASIEGREEIGEFVVPRAQKGVSIEETWDSVAMRGTASHDLVLRNVEISDKYFTDIKGSQSKPKGVGWLLHIPACYLGIAQAARNYALRFAESYQPNSLKHPISSLPNIRRLVGELELELMQARMFLYQIAKKYDEVDDKQSLQAELAAAKYIATNAAISVVDKAMRIVGAKSLSEKNPLHRYYLNVRAGLHNPPMDDVTISLMANSAFHSIG